MADKDSWWQETTKKDNPFLPKELRKAEVEEDNPFKPRYE